MNTSSPLSFYKKKIKKYTKVERKPKNPNFGPWLFSGLCTLCVASAGIFIGVGRCRVLVQLSQKDLISRNSNLSCNFLSCWSPKSAYLRIELESLINIRVVGLQVFFLEHLESSDLHNCSKSYDLNTKTCTVWIRILWIFIFALSLAFILILQEFRVG